MRKNLQYKILTAVMVLSAANWAVPANVLAGEDGNGNYIVTADGETISGSYKNVSAMVTVSPLTAVILMLFMVHHLTRLLQQTTKFI